MKNQRVAGVLLHITSLPGASDNGDFGYDAFCFVDFLANAGIKLWQVLPLGPTASDKSPYQSHSAFAGNISLISIDKLKSNSWISIDTYQCVLENSLDSSTPMDLVGKKLCLFYAWKQFESAAGKDDVAEFNLFKAEQKYWLDDFSLYCCLKEKYAGLSWVDWPQPLRDFESQAISEAHSKFEDEIRFVKFCQFIFYQQWQALKKYANSKNVSLFGDLPLFVSHDSADVWAHRYYFKLDGDGQPLVVAGVPPDYFSETGQRWGNPIYDWPSMKSDNYSWWLKRLECQFSMFDYVRIDHFRGLQAYWEIPANESTALNGTWVNAPGRELLESIQAKFENEIPLIAEDLGCITEEVTRLRQDFELPGMKILQFAFDGNSNNPYLSHNHEQCSVVYSGTHDNDTTLGWFNGLSDEDKSYVYRYFGETNEPISWLFIRHTFASVSAIAVVPMQDLMSLDSAHRMNIPGTVEGNWEWRFQWADLDDQVISAKVKTLCDLYQR